MGATWAMFGMAPTLALACPQGHGVIEPSALLRVEGNVVNSLGAPIAAARVVARNGALLLGETGADASGRFVLTGLPRTKLTVSATTQGHASVTREVDGSLGSIQCFELTLHEIGKIRGCVTDSEHVPLAGAFVFAIPSDAYVASVHGATSVATDKNGCFEVECVLGNCSVYAFSPFHAHASVSICLRDDATLATMPLLRGASRRIRICVNGSVPAADGIAVALRATNVPDEVTCALSRLWPMARTHEGWDLVGLPGSVEFDAVVLTARRQAVVPGAHPLCFGEATKQGSDACIHVALVAVGSPITQNAGGDVAAEAIGDRRCIRGTVVDARGKVIAGARVTVSIGDAARAESFSELDGAFRLVLPAATSEESTKRFRIGIDSIEGSYRYGYTMRDTEVHLGRLRLQQNTIRGRAVDAAGLGLPGVGVCLWAEAPDKSWEWLQLSVATRMGDYCFRNIADGTYIVTRGKDDLERPRQIARLHIEGGRCITVE